MNERDVIVPKHGLVVDIVHFTFRGSVTRVEDYVECFFTTTFFTIAAAAQVTAIQFGVVSMLTCIRHSLGSSRRMTSKGLLRRTRCKLLTPFAPCATRAGGACENNNLLDLYARELKGTRITSSLPGLKTIPDG